MSKPYENYQIAPGKFIDPDKRFIYLKDANPSNSGYRRALVEDSISGEQFEASFVALRTGKAKTPSEKKKNYRKSATNKMRYHEGDTIGKYHDILILDLDAEKYPPKVRKGGKTDRCGLFRNLVTGEEFVSTLNHAISKSSNKIFSLGEKQISTILNQHEVLYECQKTYDSLSGFTGGKSMAFDFFLPNEGILIEYDGAQHLLSHHDGQMFYSTEEERYIYYARDIMKEAWCQAHSIPLLRISNVVPEELQYETLQDNIQRALYNAENGTYVSFYPESSHTEYESVSVTMSHLDARYQYDFYRKMRDTCIEYRRSNDLPIEEDKELLAALPRDNTTPVLFSDPKPRSFYKKKRIPIVIGDVIGNNGVTYISDFDDNGNKITSAKGRRKALFACPCGNHFVSSFASVRGSSSNNYDGKMCNKCTKKRRREKMAETWSNKPPATPRQYKPGEYLDPDKKFRFIREEPSSTPNERKMVVEDGDGNLFTFNLSYLKSGKAKTKSERDDEKEEKTYRKISKGDIIGIDNCLIVQHDVEYHTYDNYGKISIEVYNILTNKQYTIKLSTALSTHTTGTGGVSIHEAGEIVGSTGVVFLEWCDEYGKPMKTDKKEGIVSRYAKFRCSCEKHNEFVAEWARVRDSQKQCPECMERREKEARRKNGLAHKLSFSPGDPVDPDGRYLYISEDEEATTKKRKIIIRSVETGEEFSYQLDKVRQGTVIPPSISKKNRRRGHDDNQKYQIGDIISNKKASHCIVGELEAKINSCGNPVRRFVFQNLATGYLFDSVMQSVKSGAVTGARSKKTRADYPDVELLSEEDVSKAATENKKPSRSKKTEMEILEEIGEEKIQAMLDKRASSEIAATLSVSFQAVCNYVKLHGLHNPHTNSARKIDVSSMPLDDIKMRLGAGQSMTSIGRELGYSYAWMKKAVEHLNSQR